MYTRRKNAKFSKNLAKTIGPDKIINFFISVKVKTMRLSLTVVAYFFKKRDQT